MTFNFFVAFFISISQYLPNAQVRNISEYRDMSHEKVIEYAQHSCSTFMTNPNLKFGSQSFSDMANKMVTFLSQENHPLKKVFEKKFKRLGLNISEMLRLYTILCNSKQVATKDLFSPNQLDGFVIYFNQILDSLPDVKKLKNFYVPAPLKVVSPKGEVLSTIPSFFLNHLKKEFSIDVKTSGQWAFSSEIPDILKKALVAGEDRSFYTHKGIDFQGIIRALTKMTGRSQGGSTITQQLIKNLYFAKDISGRKKLDRKIKEFMLAGLMEQTLSKEKILELYFNVIYYGSGSYGIKPAVKKYFAKKVSDISLSEASLLASLPKSPSYFSKKKNFERLKERQNYILTSMEKEGYITSELLEKAIDEVVPLGSFAQRRDINNQYIVDYVKRKVCQLDLTWDPKKKYSIKVNTILELQALAQKSLQKGLIDYELRTNRHIVVPVASINMEALEQTEVSEVDDKGSREKDKQWVEALNKIQVTPPFASWKKVILLKTGAESKLGFSDGKTIQAKVLLKTVRSVFKRSARIFSKKDYNVKKLETFDLESPEDGAVKGVLTFKVGESLQFLLSNGKEIKIMASKKRSHRLLQGDLLWLKKSKKQNPPYKNKWSIIGEELTDGDVFWAYKYDKKWKLVSEPDVQGAMVVMHQKTGDILSLVGGFQYSKASPFNFAINAFRQPGSTIKPMSYLAALIEGFDPNVGLPDKMINLVPLQSGEEKWRPKNYGGRVSGHYFSMRYGLEKSKNLLTAQIMPYMNQKYQDEVRDGKRVEAIGSTSKDFALNTIRNLMQEFGYYCSNNEWDKESERCSNTDRVSDLAKLPEYKYPIVLGTQSTSPLRVATAYARIGNGGFKVEPQMIDSITSNSGEVLYAQNRDGERTRIKGVSPQAIFQLKSFLSGVVLRGTARSASKYKGFIAGKTGTTNNNIDAWFAGITDKLSIGVWVGYPNGDGDLHQTLGKNNTGSSVALPIFKNFIAYAEASEASDMNAFKLKNPVLSNKPSGLEERYVHPKHGCFYSQPELIACMEKVYPIHIVKEYFQVSPNDLVNFDYFTNLTDFQCLSHEGLVGQLCRGN